jgi:hypothetical protein
MEAGLIKEICINGSKKYLEELSKKPNGGVEEVEIRKLEKLNGDTFKFNISKKLFDADAITFRYNGTSKKEFDSSTFQIKVYDQDKKYLIIKAKNGFLNALNDLDKKNWKIIVDLKFLIQRVINWYELKGLDIEFSTGKSNVKPFDLKVLEKNKDKPSEEQLKAIEMVFSERFSYVWGAPGTGKTRYVLSNALLEYIRRKDRVLVLAPTNVALEQVLEGVIEVTNQAGVNKKKILRLGYPSESFADKHGDICEIQGLEKELERVLKQIDILEKILGLDNNLEKELSEGISLFEKAYSNLIHFADTNKKLSEIRLENECIKKDLKFNQAKIQQVKDEKQKVLAKKNSLLGKVFSALSKKVDFDREIDQLIKKELGLLEEGDGIRKNLLTSEQQKRSLETHIDKLAKHNSDFKSQFDVICPEESFEINNLKNLIEQWKNKLKTEKEERKIMISIHEEYKKYNKAQLEAKLAKLTKEKIKLENYSLDARIENASVVAATLDTYLHRFKDKNIEVAHIFIDEAGYASIVKALTVFDKKKPVTLLGDHKQLPPVSEISRSEISKDEKLHEVFVWDQSAIYLGDFCSADSLKMAVQLYFNNHEPNQSFLPKSSLKNTFRFGPNLAEVLEKHVYPGGFKSKIARDTEIIIVDCPNPYERTRKRLNLGEIHSIKEFININNLDPDSFAILAPYRNQVFELKKQLPGLKDEDNILTIHKSQGREWDTVIYSVCDIGNRERPWFTDSKNTASNGLNNINTAVSRAKKRLIIFCSMNAWESKEDQLIADLIKAGKKVPFIVKTSIPKDTPRTDLEKLPRPPSNNNEQKSRVYRTKDYTPTKPDEEWESKTLAWSVKQKPGYRYSPGKGYWWKKKVG